MSTCTTRAHFIYEYRKGNNINIHDPVPPFQIQHPPCVLLHPNPPSSSLPLPSIGWQHLVGHMVRQLLQGNMGICGATQRKGGDNTGDVGVFVRGCRWHWGRVIAIFISCIFFFLLLLFYNSFFSVSVQLRSLFPSRMFSLSKMCKDDLCYKFYNNTLQYTTAVLVKKRAKEGRNCIRKVGFSFAPICDVILPHLQFPQEWSPWQWDSILLKRKPKALIGFIVNDKKNWFNNKSNN